MKRAHWALPLVLAFSLACMPTFGWGILGHQLIAALGVQLSQDTPFGKFLRDNRDLLVRYSISPDWEWKKPFQPNADPELNRQQVENDKWEEPLHFFEPDALIEGGIVTLDSIGAIPQGREYGKLVPEFGKLAVANAAYITSTGTQKHFKDPKAPTAGEIAAFGTLPWRVEQLHRLLVEALLARDFQKVALILGTEAHYAGDDFQPYHIVLKYNPKGIHPVYEEKILEAPARKAGDSEDAARKLWKMEKTLAVIMPFLGAVPDQAPVTADGIIGRLYQGAAGGFAFTGPLLKAWNEATERFPAGAAGLNHHGPAASPQAIQAFLGATVDIPGMGKVTVLDTAYHRIAEAGKVVHQLWQGAYDEAAQKDPKLANDIAAAAKLPDFEERYAITHYPVPDYLPDAQIPAADCGRDMRKLAH